MAPHTRARFALIIPAHNAERTLQRTLTSVLQQDHVSAVDVVVVADRCSDRTPELAESMGVRIIRADVGRAGLARNIGMDATDSEYILFLDADDYYIRSDAIRIIDERLIATGDPDVLHFAFLWGADIAPPIGWRYNRYGMCYTRAWRRESLGSLRFGDSPMLEDDDFLDRASAKLVRHEVLETPLIQYVFPNPGSITGHAVRHSHGTLKQFATTR